MKSIRTFCFLLICIGLFCIGCTSTSDKKGPYQLKQKISFLSDSSFLHEVWDINFHDDHFYISDHTRGQIIKLNNDLTVNYTYGISGEAPGRFRGITRFAFNADTIYAINEGKRTIEVFERQDSISQRTIQIPKDLLGTTVKNRFFIKDNLIYFSAPLSGAPVSILSTKGVVKNSLGELVKFDDASISHLRNCESLLRTEDSGFIAVSDNIPTIDFYDPSGKHSSQSIGDLAPLKERKEYTNKKGSSKGSFFMLFQDMCYDDHNLYLLCVSGVDRPVAKSIAVFEIRNGTAEFSRIIDLPGVWYTSFCVKGDKILAYETTTDELQLFEN